MKKIAAIVVLIIIILIVVVWVSTQNLPLTHGTWQNNTYTNTYANLTFELPEGWEYYTDEELGEEMKATPNELWDGKNYTDKALEKSGLIDMIAYDMETPTVVLMEYENLKLSGSTRITVDQYVDILVSQFAKLDHNNYEVIKGEDRVIGGKDYKTCLTKVDEETTTYFYLRKAGNYMACILITMDNTQSVDDVLAQFS